MWRALLLVAITLRPIAEAEVTILSVSVVRESHDEVELELTYILTGVRKETLAGAITTFTGSSTGQWAYRPAKLEPGTHRAVITVGRSQEAPEFYLSDGFEITVRGGVSHKHHFTFEKIWCLDPGACGEEARAALKRAATAPLVERLTAVQPSIRLTAEKEADALDEDAKRALLPEILDRLHDGELAVRLQALRVIERFDVSDPILATPLAEAMFDPHPGVSRVATSVLARLADPFDGLAASALETATHSSDASTRRYAEEGLFRIERLRQRASKPTLGVDALENEDDCAAAGGIWARFGLYEVSECNMPTPDAGRACLHSTECVSACVFEIPDAGATCYGFTILRGTCLSYVENGKAAPPLCVD